MNKHSFRFLLDLQNELDTKNAIHQIWQAKNKLHQLGNEIKLLTQNKLYSVNFAQVRGVLQHRFNEKNVASNEPYLTLIGIDRIFFFCLSSQNTHY